jgi:hypothetical protein
MQPPAMDADLGVGVAGKPAAVLAVDQLAEPVEEAALADGDAGVAEFVLQAERRKFPHRVRQQGDADAELPDLGGALEHAAGQPATVQIQGERQAGDAAADDRDVHDACAPFGRAAT